MDAKTELSAILSRIASFIQQCVWSSTTLHWHLWSCQISLEVIFWHKPWKDFCPWCEPQIWLQLQWVSYSVPQQCPSDLLCLTQEFCLMNRKNHSKQESCGDNALSSASPESWNRDTKEKSYVY